MGSTRPVSVSTMLVIRLVVDSQAVHDGTNTLTAKDSHQIIFGTNKELSNTWVSLSTGATTKLIVDTTRFMTLTAEHE